GWHRPAGAPQPTARPDHARYGVLQAHRATGDSGSLPERRYCAGQRPIPTAAIGAGVWLWRLSARGRARADAQGRCDGVAPQKSRHPPAFEYGRGRGSPFPVDKNKIAYISLVNSRAEALGYKTRKIARLLLPGVPNRFFSRDTRICLHEQVSYPTPVIRPVANLGTQP